MAANNVNQVKDIAGQKFGRLTAMKSIRIHGEKRAVWECHCECGNICNVVGKNLRSGNSQSCGCVRRKRFAAMIIKHGKYGIAEYQVYFSAKNRCTNPNNREWKNYGGRGIEFRFNSFQEFLDHVGPRPSSELSIDRIDNMGHYEIGNLRWATWKQQANNKRLRSKTHK